MHRTKVIKSQNADLLCIKAKDHHSDQANHKTYIHMPTVDVSYIINFGMSYILDMGFFEVLNGELQSSVIIVSFYLL